MPAAAPGIVRWRHRPMQCGPWTVRLSALRLPSLRMILSENRTPLFGIMRVRMNPVREPDVVFRDHAGGGFRSALCARLGCGRIARTDFFALPADKVRRDEASKPGGTATGDRAGEPPRAVVFALLRQRLGADLGDFGVLRRQHAGDADGADDLAVDQDRQSAFERGEVPERQEPQPGAAGGDGVVERLAWALEGQGGARLAFRGGDGGKLRVVELVERHQIAAAVEDGDGDLPGV